MPPSSWLRSRRQPSAALRASSALELPADWRPISMPATGWLDPASGPSKGTFQPIVGGHARFSRRFRALSTRRSSGRMPRSRSRRKSTGFICEPVPSPSIPSRTLRPGSPPRTAFHLPPAARSSIRLTACFRRRRCTDCATTAQRTYSRYCDRLCGNPASFLRSPAPRSMPALPRRRCGAADGCWAWDWASPISASLCSTAAWLSRWAEPASGISLHCARGLPAPRRRRRRSLCPGRDFDADLPGQCLPRAHGLLPLLGVKQFLQDLLVPHRPHVDRENDRINRSHRGIDHLLLRLDHRCVLLFECEPPGCRYLVLNLRVQPVIRGQNVEPHRGEEIVGGLVAFRGEHVDGMITGPALGHGPGRANSRQQTQITGCHPPHARELVDALRRRRHQNGE